MQLIVVKDLLDHPEDWIRIECDDVREGLKKAFDQWPATAKLFHGNVSKDTEVTPTNEAEIDALGKMPGPFYAIVYPGDIVFWAYVVFAVATVVLLLNPPKVPQLGQRNQNLGSSNNELSDRTNKPRVNGRIPDIFGTVRSVPDLIAAPYSVFNDDHLEVENTYMCIGRGSYALPLIDGVESIRDGQTLVSKIEGSSIEIYGPNTSPNSGTPQLTVGDPIGQVVVNAVRSKAVNGQVLRAPNDAGDEVITGPMRFRPDVGNGFRIEADSGSDIDFTTIFAPSDTLVLTAPAISVPAQLTGSGEDENQWPNLPPFDGITFASDGTITGTSFIAATTNLSPLLRITVGPITKDAITVNLSGYYEVLSHDDDEIVVGIPDWLASEWSAIAGMTGGTTDPVNDVAFFQGADITGYGGNGAIALSNSYTVSTVTDKLVELVSAESDDTDWLKVAITVPTSGYVTATVESLDASEGASWVGPFVLDNSTMNEVIANFIAPQGLWKDNGTTQTAFNIEVQLGITPCDAAGTPTGSESFYNTTLLGSANVKSLRAKTLRTLQGYNGRSSVRARRLTLKDTTFSGTIADEVKWRDVYAVSPVTEPHFGDITTVQSLTVATQAATAVSERQINILVQRKLPLRISGSTFDTELTGTNDAAEIISFICKDPTLGNRSNAEMDFDNIYDTLDAIETYFGTAQVREFNYTFDNESTSFEEMLLAVAEAIFCTPYRQGSVIKLFFERATNDSVLLFNHRNKVPNTETRTTYFGGDYDGIEYKYISPTDDSSVSILVPSDGSGQKPQVVESVGIRSDQQAFLHARRLYYRQKYRRVAVEFDATEEAELLVNNQRILVADNTRPDVQDGFIKSQDGLVLELSQPYYFEDATSYVIFLQHTNGTVESIGITAGDDQYHVVLDDTPAFTLSLDDDNVKKATYMIVKSTLNIDRRAFLMTSREPNDNFTSKVSAVNYDSRYYQDDQEFA